VKIIKKDSPIAAIVLICVLVAVVGRIFWIVIEGNSTNTAPAGTGPAAIVQPTAASSAPAAVTAPQTAVSTINADTDTDPTPLAIAEVPTVGYSRNPFASTATTLSQSINIATNSPTAGSYVKELPGAAAVRPLPAFAYGNPVTETAKLTNLPGLLPGNLPSLANASASNLSVHPSDAYIGMKVTAIIGGTIPSAVIEEDSVPPRVVRVGDTVEQTRIVAIDSCSVVLREGRSLHRLYVSWADSSSKLPSNGSTSP